MKLDLDFKELHSLLIALLTAQLNSPNPEQLSALGKKLGDAYGVALDSLLETLPVSEKMPFLETTLSQLKRVNEFNDYEAKRIQADLNATEIAEEIKRRFY